MIAKTFRVPRQLIPYILKKGALYKSKLFIIRHIDNEEKFSRYRVIVSKKLHNKAVARNKLRRQIYEAIRTNTREEVSNQQDFILIPKKAILEKKYSEIAEDLRTNIINKQFHGNT